MKMNLVNKTFGSLTVVSLLETKNYKQYWTCQCVCGNNIIRTSEQLNNKANKKHCGCQTKQITYIPGQVIGKLTVVKETFYLRQTGIHKGKRVRAWECLCECGKSCTVSSSDLFYKNTLSCGCTKQGYNKDLTGLVKESFSVIGKDTSKQNERYRYWLCKCKCGKTFSTTTTAILQDQQKSCGCSRIEYFQQLRISKGFDPDIPILPARNRKRNNSKHHKLILIKKFGLVCGNCKETVKKTQLLAMHHIIPVSLDMEKANDITNCILLCEKCHILAHGGNWQTVDKSMQNYLQELKNKNMA